jgi:tetratricopeptide (TPR) repeat protein
MRSVKVYIAAGPGLEDARRAADDVLELLNKHFRARGVEFLAGAGDEGPEGGDWTIALWWKEFGALGQEAFERACEGLKARGRPAKMHVFFKEPDEGIAEELKTFKASLPAKHGNIQSRFETVDAVRFQLAAQSLSLLPGGGNGPGERDILAVEGGEVLLEGEHVAKMENLPFAGLNEKRKSLLRQIKSMGNEVGELEAEAAASPDDEDVRRSVRDAREKRRQLEEELKQYDGYLLGMAVSFAKTAGEELDGRVAKARELFERGKVRAANKVLDLDELVETSGQTLPTFEAQRELGGKNIQALLAKAEMVLADDSLTQEERVAAASKAHEESIRVARGLRLPASQEAGMIWNYALFLQKQKLFPASSHWYGEALERYRWLARAEEQAYLPWVAASLGQLAIIHEQTGEGEEAEKEYGEALTLYRNLENGHPDGFGKELGWTLNNVAVFHGRAGRRKEAAKEFNEALEIFQKLEEADPEESGRGQALVFGNLAAELVQAGRDADAEVLFAEKLAICRKLAERRPDAHRENLAGVLSDIADVHKKLHQEETAEREYGEALEIYRGLAMTTPRGQDENLVRVLMPLAELHWNRGGPDCAVGEFEEALKIQRRLGADRPWGGGDSIATTLLNLAIAHKAMDRKDEAEKEYAEALETWKHLAQDNPAPYEARMARAWTCLADLHVEEQRPMEAEREYGEALEIQKRLVAGAPEAHEEDVARTLEKLSGLFRRQGRMAEAKTFMDAAADWYRSCWSRTREKRVWQRYAEVQNAAWNMSPVKKWGLRLGCLSGVALVLGGLLWLVAWLVAK